MFDSNLIYQIAVWTVPVLFAITVHEAAHGYAAQRFGDNTAAAAGRLSLNPIRHIDPVGTILVPLLLLILPGGFIFGWAKPVPVNFNQLGNPKRDMALVAAAGPASNLAMAFGWGLGLKLLAAGGFSGPVEQGLAAMCSAGILINLLLMVLNLLPIPPLDGSKVVAGVAPDSVGRGMARLEPYGLLILLGLIALGVLQLILLPLIGAAQAGLFSLLGLGFLT